jgi:hypothetical protein
MVIPDDYTEGEIVIARRTGAYGFHASVLLALTISKKWLNFRE